MRESFGGAFMIKLVLVFIVIYVSFMAVAINYAKAFRVKNQVINILEQSQYSAGNQIVINNVDTYLGDVNYNITNPACPANSTIVPHGVCIENHCTRGTSGANDDCYYTVTTFIHIDFPFFKVNMNLPVRGETKTIVK